MVEIRWPPEKVSFLVVGGCDGRILRVVCDNQIVYIYLLIFIKLIPYSLIIFSSLSNNQNLVLY